MLAKQIKKTTERNKTKYHITNTTVVDEDKIEELFKKYNEKLNSQPKLAQDETIKTFLSSLSLASIGEEQNIIMTQNITEKELDEAIQMLKMNKSPGIDGFPSECYKALKNKQKKMILT